MHGKPELLSCAAGAPDQNDPAELCRLRESPGGHCAPCGVALLGPSVALTFAYDYFDVVVLESEFEVRRRRPCTRLPAALGRAAARRGATAQPRDSHRSRPCTAAAMRRGLSPAEHQRPSAVHGLRQALRCGVPGCQITCSGAACASPRNGCVRADQAPAAGARG